MGTNRASTSVAFHDSVDHGGALRSMFGVGRSERAPSWAPSKGTAAWKAGRSKAAGLRPFPRNRTTVRASRLSNTPWRIERVRCTRVQLETVRRAPHDATRDMRHHQHQPFSHNILNR